MKRTDLENRVRQIVWPVPPPDLRARILSAALVGSRSITWSDRMWFSRVWRWSAVAAALVLVAIEQLSGSPRPSAIAPTPQALAEARVVEEVGRQVGLSPQFSASLGKRTLVDAARVRRSRLLESTSLTGFELDGGSR